MIVLSVIFFSDVKIVANLRKFGLQNYKKMEKYRVEEDKKIERQCKFFSLDIWFCEALLCYVFVIVENKKNAPNHRCTLYLASIDGDFVLLRTRKQPGKSQQLRTSQRSMNQQRSKCQPARMLPRCTSCCCSMNSW